MKANNFWGRLCPRLPRVYIRTMTAVLLCGGVGAAAGQPQICRTGLDLTSSIMDLLSVPGATDVELVEESVFGGLADGHFAIVKAAHKSDAIITRIGLNPAITGGPGRSLPGMLARTVASQVTRGIGGGVGAHPKPPLAVHPAAPGSTAPGSAGTAEISRARRSYSNWGRFHDRPRRHGDRSHNSGHRRREASGPAFHEAGKACPPPAQRRERK